VDFDDRVSMHPIQIRLFLVGQTVPIGSNLSNLIGG
jgi:hypothetical protein